MQGLEMSPSGSGAAVDGLAARRVDAVALVADEAVTAINIVVVVDVVAVAIGLGLVGEHGLVRQRNFIQEHVV